MGTTTDKLNALLASKNAIRDAIAEKTGEDVGEVMSTYAEKIMAIEGAKKHFRTTILIDQTITDPTTMITQVYDDGGISQIRLNSHRYVCKLVNGVMQAKQLRDNNGTLYLDGTAADLTGAEGDVMMKLPEFYYRAAEQETDKWLIDFVYGECPGDDYKHWDGKDFIGVYEGYVEDEKIYSISDKYPNWCAPPSDFKNWALNRGDGYTLLKWKHHSIMAFLFYAQYLNTNSQECIGYGKWSADSKSGVTNLLGMEDTIKNINGEQFTNFWGLERWVDNFSEIIEDVYYNDGFCVDGRIIPNVVADSYGLISKLTIGENLDAACKSVGGTSSTGFCDNWSFNAMTSWLCTRISSSGDYGGIVNVCSLQSESYITSRLAYRGVYETFTGFADVNGGYGKGVYIQDTTGRLWTSNSWNNSATPNSVAVIASSCQFVISLASNKGARIDATGSASILDNYLLMNASTEVAATDFDGYHNTLKIISAFGNDAAEAAGYCANFTFPNGQRGYLGAAGEWNEVLKNITAINECLSLVNAGEISSGTYLWTSSRLPNGGTSGTTAYFCLANFSGNKLDTGMSTTAYYCRPFGQLKFN